MSGENQKMAEHVSFDNAALDRICDRISGLRAFIRSLPHEGALMDVDTLLAVAQADASRLRSELRRRTHLDEKMEPAAPKGGQHRRREAKLVEAR